MDQRFTLTQGQRMPTFSLIPRRTVTRKHVTAQKSADYAQSGLIALIWSSKSEASG